jgi:O-antigen chain-terminating methyltransferase
MSDPFYKAFEDRYRGSREIITERLRAYLPFIEPLAALRQPARALDIGCGRGEWLELASAAGFEASGVDIDDGMLAACRERGLAVQTADGLQTLRALPDASLAMVSAFHVVEHIPFEDVRALVAEALRVLQPGGLLILETPNPENLVVGASSFYRDPSHLRPLPPELLSFAAEYAGFARQLVVRLQEPAELHAGAALRLQHVLEGVSPDYAVVAQKAAEPALLARFDAAFGAQYGVSLGLVTHRYDDQAARQRGMLDTAASHGAQALDQLVAVRESVAGLGGRVAELEARREQLQEQLVALLESRSWRLTAPLRAVSSILRRVRNAARNGTLGGALKRRAKAVLRLAGQAVLRNHRAKRAARRVLSRFPYLQSRLREMMYHDPAGPGAPPPASQQASDLSPRAQRVYANLKAAIDGKEA